SGGAPAGLTPNSGSVADSIAAIGRDYELLGDLHQKQGKMNEAIDAYSKAVQAAKTATIAQPAGEDAKANVEKVKQRVRDLSTKLARVLLDAGRVDEARKALEMDTQIKVLPPAASGQALISLPAKLTISATKKLLDQVGTGKISYDEFRKQVTLDYSSFNEPAPMPSEPKKK
ncbi:MAG TPA: tetratricopeptide repeat protein, partial [Gemmataceae bacterium]|nr:tetratricopeptide repeat protein [Gemmataceae bacterium]